MVELYLLKDTRQTSEHMGDYYPRVDYKETYDVPMLAHSNERRLVDYVFVRHDSAIQASLMALAALSVASSLPSVGTYGEEHLD